MKEQLLFRQMGNNYSLAMKMEKKTRYMSFFSVASLISFLIILVTFNARSQSLKTDFGKNANKESANNLSRTLSNGLVKLSGYENGLETEKYLDPEFYNSEGVPIVDFSAMKKPVVQEMKLTGSGCECSFNLTSNWDFNGGTSSGVPKNWSTSNGNFGLYSNSQTGNYGILNNGDNSGTYYVTQIVDAPYAAGQSISMDAYAATHSVSGTAQLYFEFLDNSNNVIGTSAKRTITNSYNDNGTPLDPINTISATAPANTKKIKIVGYSNSRALKFDSVILTYCSTLKLENPEPSIAEVNKSQVFDLTLSTNAANGTVVEWVISTQNVTSLSQLTNQTVVGQVVANNGVAQLQVTSPSNVGTYYYYAYYKPLDPCNSFVKYKITVKTIGTNDPVCLSGSRNITDNLLIGACNPLGLTYYSVWLDLKPSSLLVPTYQYFNTSDLKFEEYCDGTARIYGKACAVLSLGTKDCINIDYKLSNRTQVSPSNSPKPNSCSTYGNDLYYYKDASGTITGVSGGIYSGLEIAISDNSNNDIPAFQVGTGANVNTNDFGASGWYTLSINNGGTNGWSAKTTHGDFNFNLGALIPFELEASASATSICLDGSATLNAQFKGEVPTSCLLNYSWKAPGGSVVSTSQSFTINNIKEDQAGVYTVTASFVSNGKTCSATSTINIVVDSNCGGTPVCLPNCTPQTMVYWNLNQCNTGTGGNWYGEFEPTISKQGCSDIEATTVYRINPDTNKHSCADGPDGSEAMCVDGVSSTSKPGQNNSKAVRFSTTITPGANKTYNLAELSFKYKRSGYQCNNGGSQSLVLYVYKNGVKVYDERIDGLTTSWKSKTVSFGGTADFVSDAATTYDFELVGFNPTGGCTVWEIDEVKLNGCCGSTVPQPVINVSNANICKGESVILTASNCSGTLLWSNGANTASITVSPQTTTTYLVSCSLGGCSAQPISGSNC